jgi:predicted alpha/beta hydrolase family esterase
MGAIDRVVLVPRWGAGSDDDWYPWLTQRLVASNIDVAISPLEPVASEPEIEPSLEELRATLGDDPVLLARTVLVGHGVGCQVILRHLAARGSRAQVVGAVCVAGWLTRDDRWTGSEEWLETPIDAACVRAATSKVVVLVSDNDPSNSDHDRTITDFREHLGASVTLIPGAAHFTASPQPAVRDALSQFGIK